MSRVHIVCGFPGIGKSTLARKDISDIYDLESTGFDRNYFPENYVDRIESFIEGHRADGHNHDVLCLINSHKVLRDELTKRGIKFTLIYPGHECKEEYLQRYLSRNIHDPIYTKMLNHFDEFVESCAKQNCHRKFRLKPSEYLSDYLSFFNR